MKQEIFDKLCVIYKKLASGREPDHDFQLCMLWPNSPDVLKCTPQLENIEDAFDIDISEEDAVEMFDMNLIEASFYIVPDRERES